MSDITNWLRGESQLLADELVDINDTQFLKKNISGFGMKSRVQDMMVELNAALFPTMYELNSENRAYLSIRVMDRLNNATIMLSSMIKDVLENKCAIEQKKQGCTECGDKSVKITTQFMKKISSIRATLSTDIQAAYDGDPAAIFMEEILLGYPSISATTVYRLAHELFVLGVPIIPRIMTEDAHQRTGIDIHPGATIGTHFFIDHGTGVVIGETCVIGNHVKLYQGVTLGAKSFELNADGIPIKGVKRHPNIEDNVVIYSGATILGGDTTVGHDSIIGGNVWLVSSVPPHSKVYNSTPQPNIKMGG